MRIPLNVIAESQWLQTQKDFWGDTEWGHRSRLERTSGSQLVQLQSSVPRPKSRLLLKISKEEMHLPLWATRASAPAPSQNVSRCSEGTSSVTIYAHCLLSSSMLSAPFPYIFKDKTSLSLLFSMLNSFSSHNLYPQDRCFSPFTIFVAFCSTSFLSPVLSTTGEASPVLSRIIHFLSSSGTPLTRI